MSALKAGVCLALPTAVVVGLIVWANLHFVPWWLW